MTDAGPAATPSSAAMRHVAGTLGIVIAVLAAVILGVHPPGSTDLYDDGVEFIDHIGPLWIAIHLLAALVLLGVPAVVAAWVNPCTPQPAGGSAGSPEWRRSPGSPPVPSTSSAPTL
ncbi:MAG: hypothetical protein ACRD0A_17965 [Acidimicrobiales bacterium]